MIHRRKEWQRTAGKLGAYVVLGLFVPGLLAIGCGRGEEPSTQATTGAEQVPEPTPPAQDQTAAQRGETPAQPGAMTVSDQEVQEFATVYRRLVELEQQGAARVDGGEDAEMVARELSPQVEQIFTNSSLTPERFDEIARAADTDTTLRQRIEAELDRAPS